METPHGCLCLTLWEAWWALSPKWASGSGPRRAPCSSGCRRHRGKGFGEWPRHCQRVDRGGARSKDGSSPILALLVATGQEWSSLSLVYILHPTPPPIDARGPLHRARGLCPDVLSSPGVKREEGRARGCLGREAGRRQSVTVTCSCALLSTG